ncbi:MAG: hypothetical protein HYW70_00895 [Candidatus Nealsonbacteria bacterium]|nr:hypothetical protein [Candidatus Nealsonbacteria bacterium]
MATVSDVMASAVIMLIIGLLFGGSIVHSNELGKPLQKENMNPGEVYLVRGIVKDLIDTDKKIYLTLENNKGHIELFWYRVQDLPEGVLEGIGIFKDPTDNKVKISR